MLVPHSKHRIRLLTGAEYLLEDADETCFVIHELLLQVRTGGVEVDFFDRSVHRKLHALRLSTVSLYFVILGGTDSLILLASASACGTDAYFGVFSAPLFLFALLNAVQEKILDVRLLCVVEGLVSSQPLIFFLHLVEATLQHQDVQVARSIVGVEESENLVGCLVLGAALIFEEVLNIFLYLVVG